MRDRQRRDGAHRPARAGEVLRMAGGPLSVEEGR